MPPPSPRRCGTPPPPRRCRVIEAEVLATRYRLRAIEDRWIPRLEQALAEVTLALEEQELADAARLRLAVSPDRRLGAR